MDQLQTLLDERDIRDLVARYADAVIRRDKDAWGDTWAADGRWKLPGARLVEGREAIVELWLGAMARFKFVAQIIHQGLVRMDGDEAFGRFTLTEHLQFADGGGMFNVGVYQDRYVNTADGWRFAERHYTALYNDQGSGDMTGAVVDYPELKFQV
ncbi:MAG: nuclear transport factor 2 family protein [Pseudomonadota bacterium]